MKNKNIKIPQEDDLLLNRKNIINKSTAIFISNIKENEYPDDYILKMAKEKTESLIIDELLNDNVLQSITEINDTKRASQNNISIDLLKSEIYSWQKNNPLKIPNPSKYSEIINWRISLTAIIGTILGGYLLPLFFVLIMNKPDALKLGMIIGGPLGAFIIVYLHCSISQNRVLKGSLFAGLAIVTIADIFLLFKSSSGIVGLWKTIRGKQKTKGFSSFLKRLLAYTLILLILLLAKRKTVYSIDDYRDVTRISIELWMDKVIMFIQALIASKPIDEFKEEIDYAEIIESIFKLEQTPNNELSIAVEELIVTAKNSGAEFPQNESVELIWEDDFENKYRKYGSIDEGQKVFIENPPVIVKGKVLKKGLVRKVRELNGKIK